MTSLPPHAQREMPCMPDADSSPTGTRAKPGRLGTAAAWISAIFCLPYLVLKVVWAFGVPLGIADRSVLDSDGWVAANALMAAIELAGLLVVLALIRPWSHRLPAWLLLFPVWVGPDFSSKSSAPRWSACSPPSRGWEARPRGVPTVGVRDDVFGLRGQGIALAIAFACHVRGRWGGLLSTRTDEVLRGTPTGGVQWRPEVHLTKAAEAVAARWLFAVAVICC